MKHCLLSNLQYYKLTKNDEKLFLNWRLFVCSLRLLLNVLLFNLRLFFSFLPYLLEFKNTRCLTYRYQMKTYFLVWDILWNYTINETTPLKISMLRSAVYKKKYIKTAARWRSFLAISLGRVVVPSPKYIKKPTQHLWEATLQRWTISILHLARYFETDRHIKIL